MKLQQFIEMHKDLILIKRHISSSRVAQLISAPGVNSIW